MALRGASTGQLARSLRAAWGQQQSRALVTQSLPDLPYDYSELEPVICAEIMELHHKKHHQTYVTALNATAEKFAEADYKGDIATMIALQSALKFNRGGHVNHSIFWTNLVPPKDFEPPSGELLKAIESNFGSLDNMISIFSPKTAAVQGSGWGWLGYSKDSGKLVLETTANQDPLSTKGLVPLLGVDVWEHAYYLQYKNVRPEYLKNIWKIVNWKNVAERLEAAK
ncbi:hypothetical protein WJX81_000430 [Elliptochloris bilobata]|uniref:Superoxide dismutase n=1 Tax=Elliptochloris bilobata TaxID=381761 RepID=A0AAW1S4V3_9CHLO